MREPLVARLRFSLTRSQTPKRLSMTESQTMISREALLTSTTRMAAFTEPWATMKARKKARMASLAASRRSGMRFRALFRPQS